jgi:hypothetical protein
MLFKRISIHLPKPQQFSADIIEKIQFQVFNFVIADFIDKWQDARK